jgi:Na+-translocating ferredoxin:NAD+ oxidoreductase subunit B
VKPVPAAVIDEGRCIGCTLCIEACPVDAIVGARGLMHTVVEPWCIGCELCVAPCPVDCIAMVARQGEWTPALRRAAGGRGRRRAERLRKNAIRPASKDRKAVLKKLLGR